MSSPSPFDALTRPIDLSVKARSCERRVVQLEENDQYHFAWQVMTEYDIQFGFSFTPTGSSAPSIVEPPQKLHSHSGQFLAPQAGALTINFDNGHSKLRSKNVQIKEAIVNKVKPKLLLGTLWKTPYGPAELEGYRAADGIYTVRLPYAKGYFTAAAITAMACELEVRNSNERCLVGVTMFFNNEIEEAQALFATAKEESPVFSLCYGTMAFLKAFLSWEKHDIHEAMECLEATKTLAQSLSSSSSGGGVVSSLKSLVTRAPTGQAMTPIQLESSIILSETYLLQSTLLFTEESYFAYMKAGLKIRSAWKTYEKCQRQLELPEFKDEAAQIDRSTRGGIFFGVGTFNSMISIMPAVILKIVSVLGFPSDRFLGLRLLRQAADLGGIRSPLASLTMLFYDVVVPQFFTVRPDYHIQRAEATLQHAFASYKSSLFHWMNGRLQRMKRDLPGAARAFTVAHESGPKWKQLYHICSYELGFVYFFQGNMAASSQCFNMLEKENSWSKAFFIYMQAVAHFDATSDEGDAEAKQCLLRLDEHLNRNFGGKKLSIEAFVAHRANEYMNKGIRPVLPSLEIIYLFYGFLQMDDAALLLCLERVNERLKFESTLNQDTRALCLLIKVGILKGLKRRIEALAMLEEAQALEGDIVNEKYIIPFLRFELASLKMEELATAVGASADRQVSEAEYENIRTLLKKAEAFKGEFFFKNRLHFRIHLAMVELKLMKERWSESGLSSASDAAGADAIIEEEINRLAKDGGHQELTEEEMKMLEKEVEAEKARE